MLTKRRCAVKATSGVSGVAPSHLAKSPISGGRGARSGSAAAEVAAPFAGRRAHDVPAPSIRAPACLDAETHDSASAIHVHTEIRSLRRWVMKNARTSLLHERLVKAV